MSPYVIDQSSICLIYYLLVHIIYLYTIGENLIHLLLVSYRMHVLQAVALPLTSNWNCKLQQESILNVHHLFLWWIYCLTTYLWGLTIGVETSNLMHASPRAREQHQSPYYGRHATNNRTTFSFQLSFFLPSLVNRVHPLHHHGSCMSGLAVRSAQSSFPWAVKYTNFFHCPGSQRGAISSSVMHITYMIELYMSAMIPYHSHCFSISWEEIMKSWLESKCHAVFFPRELNMLQQLFR